MKKILSYLFLSLVVAVLLLMVVSVGAQTTRIKLTQIEKANTVNGTKANQLPLSNGVGDLRYSQYTEINPVAIGYTPAATGNPTANYAQFVTPANGDVWYIDNEGRGIRLYVAAAAGDYDWLEIGNNMIPNSINDSIYKYNYASIGGRLVWPTAELLVIDSVAQGMFIVAGDRKAKVALYDTNNQTWCTLEQGGGTTALIMQDGGVFSIQTAGSGTPQAPGTPIVEHFNVLGDSSIQFPQYPSTRTDAGTPTKLWGPDATGRMQNYAVSALPVTLPGNVAYRDSVNTFTLNQVLNLPTLTGSSATNGLQINQTWNTTGAPSLLDINLTNSASSGNARLFNFKIGGTSRFSMSATAQLFLGSNISLYPGLTSSGVGSGVNGPYFNLSTIPNADYPGYSFNITSSAASMNVNPTVAANFAGGLNVSPGVFGINYTGANTIDYRPVNIAYTINNLNANSRNATGVFLNATETLLNGMSHNLMDLQTGGVSRFRVDNIGNLNSTGFIVFGSGASISASGRSVLRSSADGNFTVTNNAGNSFNMFLYGGTTSSFPAIKRNGATIETRLADDTNFAATQSLYQRFGAGSPEGVVTAPVGAIYSNTTGSAGTTLYEKISGTGNTGWSAIAGGGGITGTISSGQIAVGSGANAIGGSSALTYTGNKLQINPTYTSTASGDAGVLILGTTTGSGTVGHRVVGTSVSPTAVAGANDQTLNAFEINAAFTNGAFTGVTNNIFAVREGGNNKFSVSSTGGTSTEQLYARGGATTVSYVAASGTSGTATRNYGGDLAFNMTFQAGGTPSISDYIEITFATPLPTGTKPIVTWKECSGTDLELIYKMYTSEIQKSNTKFRFYFQVAPPSTSRTVDVHVIGG